MRGALQSDTARGMENPEEALSALRARIDALDEQLAELLNIRIGVIREVAALKAEHWPNGCHIRPGREGQMHKMIEKRFTGASFPPLAALAIWRQLIGASTHLESPLNISYLSTHPEHLWLGREYFGVQVGLQPSHTLVDGLAHLRNGSSNILLLPNPSVSDWWKGAEALKAAGVFIFATLPVVAENLPSGMMSAVALAKLTPEDSGDDISYHVEKGELIVRPGFLPDEPGVFLGAHPRAISLGV